MTSHRNTLLALALAAGCAAAFAQSSTTPDNTIGVTNSEAKDAMKQAVPRSDTATVTRTGESAADKARQAGNATADALTPGTSGSSSSTTGSGSGTTGSGSATGTGPDTSGMGSGGSRTGRAARADRG